MADLEHDIQNTPNTIFDVGSVSKQFTAAAILLLAHDGKLSLDDQVRKYIPELPDYGMPLTIRQMLMHTSGLRDWGAIVEIAGSPRWTRIYTQDDALQIASRQRALNFAPGTQWSYTNTGYNLAAIIVSRVAGSTFAEFTQSRIFEPLQMTHTSWDTDHTRVVRGRAVAYAEQPDGFHTFIPFEDVYGNRGLLTTVGDLLKWNRNFDSPVPGDRDLVTEAQQAGHLADGRPHAYAFGLALSKYKGVREFGHDGGTAGYRADLIRFPDQRLSVVVLCNATTADATKYAHDIADIYLHPTPPSENARVSAPHLLTPADVDRVVGLYRSRLTGRPLSVDGDSTGPWLQNGGMPVALTPISASRLSTRLGNTFTIDGTGDALLADGDGILTERYARVQPANPSFDNLRDLVGVYVSSEANAKIAIALDGESLVLARDSVPTIGMIPIYADAFDAGQLGTVIFRRDNDGRINALSVVQDRVWDLRFARLR